MLGTALSHVGSSAFRMSTCGPQSPTLAMYCVPSNLWHASLPWNVVVTDEVAVEEAVVVTLDEADDVAVDVSGTVVAVVVAELVTVV